MTERDLLDLLRRRYSQRAGNGDRYAFAEHVRSHAGFDARRTADFVAMDLWPSKRFALHGHEIKVGRGDWLRELRDPGKAAEFTPYLTYWWVVAPPGVVRRDELPDGWGLMEPVKRRPATYWGEHLAPEAVLRVIRQARRNPHQLPLPPTRIAALLRAVTKTARHT